MATNRRAFWKGYLKLPLVTCAVTLYAASTKSHKTRFNQINRTTGNRLRRQMVDEETGRTVEGGRGERGSRPRAAADAASTSARRTKRRRGPGAQIQRGLTEMFARHLLFKSVPLASRVLDAQFYFTACSAISRDILSFAAPHGARELQATACA